jgi:hypothetical protein
MSMGWVIPMVGVRVVERRRTRPAQMAMPEGGWVYRPFMPPALHQHRPELDQTETVVQIQAASELTEAAEDRTIAAG